MIEEQAIAGNSPFLLPCSESPNRGSVAHNPNPHMLVILLDCPERCLHEASGVDVLEPIHFQGLYVLPSSRPHESIWRYSGCEIWRMNKRSG